MKSERVSELITSRDELSPRKEKGPRATSSESTSSEILDADSPRTIDSGHVPLLLPMDKIISGYPQISTDLMMDSNLMHMTDHLCDRVLSPHDAYHRVNAVKLEEGSFQEDSCGYLLTQLDEQGPLPWWDWA